MAVQENNKIHAILVKPGQEPEICGFPADESAQMEAIMDILGGNIGSTEFFNLGNGASLLVLVNDFSVPLRLQPNRRFPGQDRDEIIFGNAIFIAAYNEESENEGVVDMPERICRMFIEQIKLNFQPCRGDETPNAEAEIYVENAGTPEERKFIWREIEKPANTDVFIRAGRAKLIEHDAYQIIEINGRYFQQVHIEAEKTPIH